MIQQPIVEEPEIVPEAATPSPLRGLLIAVPLAIGLWVAVVELARLFV